MVNRTGIAKSEFFTRQDKKKAAHKERLFAKSESGNEQNIQVQDNDRTPHKKRAKRLPEGNDESPETARAGFEAPVQFFSEADIDL